MKCIISAPVDTYSGYGARSRDIVTSLIKKYPDWDIKIVSRRWGSTGQGFLKDHQITELSSRIIKKIEYKPDIWIQVTIPNEFKPLGSFNIGITAGIETTVCDSTWIEGLNRMDLVITSSVHSKNVFDKTVYTSNNQEIKANTPIEVLFEGVDTETYFKTEDTTNLPLEGIDNPFCFLVVGHWMKGGYGHDRKNIGYTIKTFLETFKNSGNPPALLLKTQKASASIIDRDEILKKVDGIRKKVGGTLPDIYLLHGNLSDSEMNALYNHPKIKAMVSLTKGEGFGRPLLEFSTTGKPIICSNWSGPQDFLHPEYSTLLPGKIHNVHPSSAVDKMILTTAKWFHPDEKILKTKLKKTFKFYKKVSRKGMKQRRYTLDNFTLLDMEDKLKNILDKYVKDLPKKITLNLPDLS